MITMVLISTVAILTAIVGCVVIWGYDAKRAVQVEREVERRLREGAPRPALVRSDAPPRAIDRR